MGNIVRPLWAECPAVTRLLVVGYPALSVMSFVLVTFGLLNPVVLLWIFGCDVSSVLGQWHIWAMVTCPFWLPLQGGFGFLSALFEMYMAMVYFPTRERELGSTTFLIWILLMSFLVSSLFLAMVKVGMLVGFISPIAGPHNLGLWPLAMLCITRRCMSEPNGVSNFWGMVQIPNKWYPLALTGFFFLLSGMQVQWNLIAALIIGYGYDRLRPERLLPTRPAVGRLEQRCCGGSRRNCVHAPWLTVGDTQGYEVDPVDRRYTTLSEPGGIGSSGGSSLWARGRSVFASSGNEQFQTFGGAGNRLGEADEDAIPMQEVRAQASGSPPTAAAEAGPSAQSLAAAQAAEERGRATKQQPAATTEAATPAVAPLGGAATEEGDGV